MSGESLRVMIALGFSQVTSVSSGSGLVLRPAVVELLARSISNRPVRWSQRRARA